MCGIAGLWQTRPQSHAVHLDWLAQRMADAITHRGPDGAGVWIDANNRCALSHRRLSIIDTSSAGAQPFHSHDHRWQLTFNGEIYNFIEIREILERRGHVFTSRSDTEVLVEAIAEWGPSAVDHLDGMFAFAAFDTKTGQLIVARDPFGEKPFYFTTLKNGVLAFASELRALELLPDFDNRISMDALAEYLCFQYVGAPRTIYESVQKLKPGHITVFPPGEVPQTRRYFEFNPGRDVTRRSFADATDELEAILLRSIERRLVSDVPLGAFLSGGVDSSLVCALVTQKLRIPLNTYSMGFTDAPESEHLVARAFADHIGARHHESIISPDVGGFLDIAGRVLDEPNADTSCFPTYLLSEFARRHVTVAVSGDGGDEMFGGYGRYSATLLERDVHGIGELPFWNPGSIYYGPRILISTEDDVAALLGGFPTAAGQRLRDLRHELDTAEHLLPAMRRTDVEHYMPGAVLAKVDRMSMQHSLEVRTPFLNVELARFAETMPDQFCCGRGFSKRILRELAGRYLPKALVHLPKQGFGLPMADWTRESLLPRAKAMLTGDGVLHGVFKDSLRQAVERHDTPEGFNAYRLWSIVVLDAWLRERDVIFPELPARRQAPQEDQDSRHAYWAAEYADKVFVVASGSRSRAPHSFFDSLTPRLQSEFSRLTPKELLRKGAGEPQLLDLDTDDLSKRALSSFSYATLFFVDADAALRIGSDECARLRSMRVSRIVMPHRFDEHDIEDLTFQYASPARKIFNAISLWRHRNGAYVRKDRLGRLLAGRALFPQAKHMYYRENTKPFVGPPDRELSNRYAVYQGMVQCPPLRVDFADVDRLGGGRYWIYNDKIGVSSTGTSRGIDSLFWSVPMTHETARYLDILPTALDPRAHAQVHSPVGEPSSPAENPQYSSFDDMLESLVANAPLVADANSLMPGDKIAVFTHALPPGGAERQWVYLASALVRMGFAVTFIVLNPLQGENAHYLSHLRTNGVEVLQCCDLPGSEAANEILSAYPIEAEELIPRITLAQIVNAIRLASPRIIFAQLDYPNIVAAIAGLFCDVEKIVLSFRNYNPSHFDYVYKPWYQSAYRILSTSPRIVLTGNYTGANDDYADWIGVPRSRVITIPNALDNDIFPTPSAEQVERLREGFGITEETQVILGVFRFSDEKRPLVFIEVVREIAEQHENVCVILAGVGPRGESMRNALAGSPASNRIHLVGKRDDVNVLMAVANMLLHTAAKEGMPNVVMEAIVSGVPVVATDAGAISSLIVDRESGFLHAQEDKVGLRDSCVRLITDAAVAKRMREAALLRGALKFSPTGMAQQYLDVAASSTH